MRPPPIRMRLALWSTASMFVVVAGAGVAVTAALRDGLRNRAHESLEVPFRVIEHRLATDPDTSLRDLLDVAPPGGERRDEVIGQLLDASGTVVDSSGEPAVTNPLVGRAELAAASRDGEWHEPRHLAGRDGDDIVVVVPVGSGARAGSFVVLAQTLAPTEDEVDGLVRLLVIVAPVVLLTALVGGSWIAKASLRPVDALTCQASLIDPEASSATLPVPRSDDEISRLARALNEMLERLRGAIERERRFSADASHELRTPLALMATSLDVELRSGETPPAARPLLESLREDVARLARTVEDLLVLSRADAAGHVEIARTEVDLLDLAMSVVARFAALATGRGIAVEVDGTPVLADVDPHLLGQALANLVDNALKFSERGARIEVTVSDGVQPAIAVRDHGVGIAAEHQAHLFDRFYQADPARGTGGSGLGLAIVASIVEAHGGAVEVDSSPGDGSTFTIRLAARARRDD